MDGTTHAIMTNEEIKNDYQPYGLERELRVLRDVYPDIYIFAVLDCCRELVKVIPESVMKSISTDDGS